jgi:dolichyl-phosphate-mannose-protein mannosyltransferase
LKTITILSYLIFFLGIGGIYLVERKKLGISPKIAPSVIRWVLLIGLFIRLILAVTVESFSTDINLFQFWSQRAAEGLFRIYQGDYFLDYPPFYLYILFFIGKIAALLGLTGGEPLFILLLKLPSIFADLITAYTLYQLAKKRLPGIWPVLISVIYVFNPAVIINSTIWGQVDSFLVLFFALGLLLMDSKRPAMAGLPLAIGVLIKPQGLIILPIVFFELLKQRDWKLLIKTAIWGIGTIAVLILPFVIVEGPAWIFDLYMSTADGYKYVSLNAFNFFSLIGANLKPDSETFLFFSYKTWGTIFILASIIYSVVLHWKGKGKHLKYVNALILFMAVFMLSVRMHERYLFPALFFLAVILILTKDRWSLVFYGIASFSIFANTMAVLDRQIKFDYPHVSPDDPLLIFISLVNVLLFIAVLIWSWRVAVQGKTDSMEMREVEALVQGGPLWFSADKRVQSNEEYTVLKVNMKDIIIMTVMTVVYLVIAFINLGSFDVPQTEWASTSNKDGFLIELESEQYVSRISFYSGLGEGSYQVWYQDAEETFHSLEDLEVDDLYKWHSYEVSQLTIGFKIKAKKSGGMLKEIAVFGSSDEGPLPIRIRNLDGTQAEGDLLNLVDEQDIAQYRARDFMTSTYFDEIYHPRTAYEHLNRIRPYEWTHPPLGKILIAIGISLFGMNAFGWRIVGTLVGAMMIPLMYLFGRKLFKNSFYGFCAAFLMMFDLMHFAQTRIGTIDSYTTFFVMLMFYFMTDYYLHKSYEKGFYSSIKPLFLSGLFFGLGAATKWSAIYGGLGLAIIFFTAKYREYGDYKTAMLKAASVKSSSKPAWLEKFIPVYMWKTMAYCILFFIVIPGLIYLLSYIPYLLVPGMKFSDIIDYQGSMYRYHSGLESTHDFQSQWWSWPLMIRPIWYYQGKDLPTGMASTIASFGNPAVWWAAIPAFFIAVRAAWKGNKAMFVVVIAVLSQMLPWMLVSRSAFIYHFFPMVPFMMLSVVYVIKQWIEKGRSKKMVYGYLVLVIALFILFYPAVSGLIVPESYIKFLRWLPSWYF